MDNNINPFEELPEGLVEEMLSNAKSVSSELLQRFKEAIEKKKEIREELDSLGYLRDFSELEGGNIFPTSAGVDGSYVIERMLSSDFACVAAVAVEGLTPPGPEKRKWPRPRYFSHIESVRHNEDTSQVLRGISAGLELHLTVNAPHDVVFLDGSLKTPLIYLNNAAVKIKSIPNTLRDVFLYGKDARNEDQIRFPGFKDVISSYENIVKSERTDKIYAAVPKYTTRNEVSEELGYQDFEDRGLLNFVLKGGEYIGPIERQETETVHITLNYFPDDYVIEESLKRKIEYIVDSVENNNSVLYFRPTNFSPVMRVEVPKPVSRNKQRLRTLLEAIKIQTVSPSVMEPYPLYLADRMVKHLSVAVPAIRKSSFQAISEKWEKDISDIYFGMHSYRTEGG